MKTLTCAALIVLSIMGFALVSGGYAPTLVSQIGPMCWTGSCPDMSKPAVSADVNRPSGPYGCIGSPAYTHYYHAYPVACPVDWRIKITPIPTDTDST